MPESMRSILNVPDGVSIQEALFPSRPSLPDPQGLIDQALDDARRRRDFFQKQYDEAVVEMQKCDEFVARLTGIRPQKTHRPKGTVTLDELRTNVSADIIRAAVMSVGNHNGCAAVTVAADTGKALSTALRALRIAVADGYVRRERRARGRYRFWITEKGMEWLTSNPAHKT
jgi:hypothetical protein